MGLELALQVFKNQQPHHALSFNSSSHSIIKIGRGTSATVQLQDPSAARVHAVIELEATKATLIDMGSASGSRLNGQKINRAQLNTGDRITIGQTEIGVQLGAAAAAQAPAFPGAQAAAPLAAPPGSAPGSLTTGAAGGAALGAVSQSAAQQPAPQPPNLSPHLRALIEKIAEMPNHLLPELDKVVDQLLLHGMLESPQASPFGQADNAWQTPKTTDDSGYLYPDTQSLSLKIKKSQAQRQRKTIVAAVGALGCLGLAIWGFSQMGSSVPTPAQNTTLAEADEMAPDDAASGKALFDTTEAESTTDYLYVEIDEPRALRAVGEEFLLNPDESAALLLEANPKATGLEQRLTGNTKVRVPRFTTHTIQPGESLGVVAQARLGDSKKYTLLHELNSDILPDPSAVEVGMQLKVPLLKTDVAP